MSEEINWDEFKENFTLPAVEAATQELLDQVIADPAYVDIAFGNILVQYNDLQVFANDFFRGDLKDAVYTLVAARAADATSAIGIGAESKISVEPFAEGWDAATKTIHLIDEMETKAVTVTIGGAIDNYDSFRDMAEALDISVEACFMILLGNIDASFDN